MTTLTHSLETGQASGTAISAANSGTGGNAFNSVSVGAGASLTYNSTALRGSLSLLATTGGTSTTASADWTSGSISPAMSRVFGRFLIRPSVTGVATVYLRCRGGGAQNFRITCDATNHLTLRSATSSGLVTSTGAMTSSDTWLVRFDVTIGSSATGVLYVHYDPAVATPDETLTANSSNFGTANTDEANWGIAVAAANTGVRLDELVLTDVSLPGIPQQTVSPSVVLLTSSVPAPTVDVATSATATPGVVSGAVSVPSVSVSTGATATSTIVAASTSVPAVAPSTGSAIAPSTVSGVATVHGPAVSTSATASPAPVTAVGSVPATSVATGSTTSPSVVAAVAAVATPMVSTTGDAIVPAPLVAAFAAVPAASVSVSSDATVSPGAVTAVTVVYAPAVSTGGTPAVVTPAAILAPATVNAPALSVGVSVTPAVVLVAAAVFAPQINDFVIPGRMSPRARTGAGTAVSARTGAATTGRAAQSSEATGRPRTSASTSGRTRTGSTMQGG